MIVERDTGVPRISGDVDNLTKILFRLSISLILLLLQKVNCLTTAPVYLICFFQRQFESIAMTLRRKTENLPIT